MLADALGVDQLPSIYGFSGAFARAHPVHLSARAAAGALGACGGSTPSSRTRRGRWAAARCETFRTVVMPQLVAGDRGRRAARRAVRDQRLRRRLDHALRLVHARDLHLLQVELRPHRDGRARDGAGAADARPALGQRAARCAAARSIASGPARRGRRGPYALGRWRWPALGFCSAIVAVALVLPVGVLIYWATKGLGSGGTSFDLARRPGGQLADDRRRRGDRRRARGARRRRARRPLPGRLDAGDRAASATPATRCRGSSSPSRSSSSRPARCRCSTRPWRC